MWRLRLRQIEKGYTPWGYSFISLEEMRDDALHDLVRDCPEDVQQAWKEINK